MIKKMKNLRSDEKELVICMGGGGGGGELYMTVSQERGGRVHDTYVF